VAIDGFALGSVVLCEAGEAVSVGTTRAEGVGDGDTTIEGEGDEIVEGEGDCDKIGMRGVVELAGGVGAALPPHELMKARTHRSLHAIVQHSPTLLQTHCRSVALLQPGQVEATLQSLVHRAEQFPAQLTVA
jgi:hypothetical protein